MTALMWAGIIHADPDNASPAGRTFTDEHPLIYEDAWDLWPYVFLDDAGKPTGFNVDLIEIIMKELDIPYKIQLKPTQQALEDLRAGRSDLMLGMVANFHDDYTRGYGKSIVHLFTHSLVHLESEPQQVYNVDDLASHKVIVHDGSFSHHLMQDRGWGDNAIPYSDMDKAVQMASAEGRGEILWNTMSLKWLIRKYHADNLTLSPVDMPSGNYRFMSNDSVLLNRVDETYAYLKATEQLQPLEMKWFYPEDIAHTASPRWMWYMAAAVGSLALILALIALAYYVQERRVTRDGRNRIARLSLILKTCQVRIWTCDLERRIITWYGDDARPERTFTQEEFSRRYEPQEYERLQQAIRQLREREEDTATVEMHVNDEKDNKRHTYSVTLSMLKNDQGLPSVIIGTKHDITEERELQQSIDELMKRYQAVFSTAMVDMILYDDKGNIITMNERAQQTFGITPEQGRQRGTNVFASLDQFSHDMEYCHLTQFLTPTGEKQEHRHSRLTDAMCYELQLVPVFDSEHRLLGIYSTGFDVTEVAKTYRRAQANVRQLKQTMDELASYVNNINYAMQVGGVRMVNYSPDTHVLTINHRMHEAQYVLTQQRCIDLSDAVSVPAVMRLFRAMDRRQVMPIESEIKTRLRIKGDRRVCLLAQLFPTLDADGRVTAYSGILRDTTEIKHTETMLQKETEKAQEVEQLKNKFLHNMCYEIRTPLDTVVSNAELFEQQHTPEAEAKLIDTIKTNTSYLLNLINDILFLSRLDARMVEFNPMPCDFSQTFESHCLTGWNGCRREGVTYTVENHYEQLVVNIDDVNVGRIIEQVVKNAAEHTESGTVRARYEYIGGKLMVIVDDTGPGISPAVLNHIFERFNTTTAKDHRTGLGMPICKELATQMGGTIEVTSEMGKGTTVWLAIPCEATVAERKKDI